MTTSNPEQTVTGAPSPDGDLRPATILKPSKGLLAPDLRAVWEYRELLLFLVWRDIKVRYKQTALGVAWILLQPILSVVVFTVIFGILLDVPSGDVPYPVFALAGLLPWQYFASSLTRVGSGLVNSAQLITKVYFPRLIIPISGVLSTLVDFAIGFVVLLVLLFAYHMQLTPRIVMVIPFLALAIVTALAFGLWLSALNVRYRDINYLIPFMLQIWLYLTPVVYGSSLIPEQYRFLLALNPMTAVVEGFRWAIIGPQSTDPAFPIPLYVVSIAITLIVLVSGLVYFRQTERTFADII
jgi:lipopolysaccharide transport system permease protein